VNEIPYTTLDWYVIQSKGNNSFDWKADFRPIVVAPLRLAAVVQSITEVPRIDRLWIA
jgi:hypothetical protein